MSAVGQDQRNHRSDERARRHRADGALRLSEISSPFDGTHDPRDVPAEADEIRRLLAENPLVIVSCADEGVLRACLFDVAEGSGHTWHEVTELSVPRPRPVLDLDPDQLTSASVLTMGDLREKRDSGADASVPAGESRAAFSDAEPERIPTNDGGADEHDDDRVSPPANRATGAETEPNLSLAPELLPSRGADDDRKPLDARDIAESIHEGSVVVVVWATSIDAKRDFLGFLRRQDDHQDVRGRLESSVMKLVIVTRVEYLPIGQNVMTLRSKLRDVKRSLSALDASKRPSPSGGEPTATFQNLLCEMFGDARSLLSFVRAKLPKSSQHWLPSSESTVAHAADQVVRLLANRQLLEGFFDALETEDTRNIEEIERCRESFAVEHKWNDKKREQLLQDLDSIERKLEKSGSIDLELVEIDAVGALLAKRLGEARRRHFERQRRVGSWGESESAMAEELRTCIEDGRLDDEVQGRTDAGVDGPSRVKLQDLKPIHLIVLFVATFVPGLDPVDFEAVVKSLIVREQVHLQAAGLDGAGDRCDEEAAEGARPGTRSLVQIWQGDGDIALDECFVEVRGCRRVGWRVRRHAGEWKRILRCHRHYFVVRQLGYLTEHSLFSHEVSESVLQKTINLHAEHFELSDKLSVEHWNKSFDALASWLQDNPQSTHAQVICDRLREVLPALHRIEGLRGTIDGFLQRLASRAPFWALWLIDRLAHWLEVESSLALCRKIFGAVHTRNPTLEFAVIKAVAKLGGDARQGDSQRAWDIIHSWLPRRKRGRARPTLGFRAVLFILSSSTAIESRIRRNAIEEAVWRWAGDRHAPVPKPVVWLFDPGVATFCEHQLPGLVEMSLRRILLPPWPIDERRSLRNKAISSVCTEELWLRFDDQLVDLRLDGRKHWYPIFVAGVLVAWELRRMVSGGPTMMAFIEKACRHTRLSELAMRVSGVLAAFSEALARGQGYEDEGKDDDDDEPDPRSMPDFFSRMRAAVQAVRAPLESHVRAAQETHDV